MSSTSSTSSSAPEQLKKQPLPLGRITTRTSVDINHFVRDDDLNVYKKLTRTATHQSTHTQDPTDDNYNFTLHLQHVLRKSEEQGILRRETGVSFQGLTVSGNGSGLAYAPSMGDIVALPARLPGIIASARHPVRKQILANFTGSVKPKEMLLVLGRPGAGCSSLLKVLSNNVESFTSIEGTISYDGLTPAEMAESHAGDIAYLPEDDVHLPLLTVGQTLRFAAASRTPAGAVRGGRTREEFVEERMQTLVTLLGLRHTLNTKVGNDVIRGVSGGERKRVSIAEMMTTGCKIGCHDNSTRGLDSSTALEYCRALRIATDIQHLATIISIYQCGESMYSLFDKVCLIYEGHMIYYGRMESAVQFFIDMGYEPQNRQTSADFLVAVTDPNGRFVRDGFEGKVPVTAVEFADYFAKSEMGRENIKSVDDQAKNYAEEAVDAYRASARSERAKNLSPNSNYLISYPMQLRLAMTRRLQMQLADLPTLAIISIAAIFQSLIIGSVYYQMAQNTGGFFLRGGVIFFAILYNSFTGMAEIAVAFGQRPIVVRHRQFAMIRPSADILALNVVDAPFKLVSIFFFDVILYFLSGLQVSASQFFIFFLFTYVTNLAMLALFRALASVNRAEANATTLAGILVLIVAIYTGYAIPRVSMKVWFTWLSYAQPVSFAFEALMANEFRTLNVPCSQLIPSGVGYEAVNIANQICATAGAVAGQSIVSGSEFLLLSFGYTYANVWRNLGIIIAYLIFFLAVNAISTEYQRDESANGAVMIFKRGAAPAEVDQANKGGDSENQLTLATPQIEQDEKKLAHQISASANIIPSSDIFTWRNVRYDVDIKGHKRRLLDDVSGYVAPGKMTALMGESGAGKTTLLNVLAQRTTMGVVGGDTFVNGKPLPVSFQRQTGYCQQQDTHMVTSTVREALVFSALLRQPSSVPDAEKVAYVDEVIRLLEMESYAEAIVGDVGQGLNVEQRKRLTIGVELAAKPALLIFLDEPTSGLDSQSAWSIMQLLRKLADHGQAILATIHQPSSELFQVFDRLLLLKKGGQTVYFGDIGENSTTLIDYFHQRTDLRCGPRDNPAEYILEAIGAGAGAKASSDWHQTWKDSDEFKKNQEQITKYHQEFSSKASAADAEADSGRGYAASTLTQLKLVTYRAFQNYWRDPTYVMAKVMLNIVAGLFIGFSFFQSPGNLAGLQNKLFGVFMAVVLAAPLSQQLQPKFLGFRTLYEARERPSRLYSWPVLVFSGLVVEAPWNIFAGTLFYCCWYFTVGFPFETSRAAYAYLMYMLFELYFATFAQAVASFSPNSQTASILFSTFFSFVIIFNGVVVPIAQLPYFWRSWMAVATPFRYLIEGLVSNALGGQPVICQGTQFNFLIPPSGVECLEYLQEFVTTGFGYAEVVNGRCGYCPYANGDQYLATLTYSFSSRYLNIGIMCIYIIFNIFAVFTCTYLFSIFDWGSLHFPWTVKSSAAESTPNPLVEEK